MPSRSHYPLAAGLLLLAGCGAGADSFAPPCPRPSIPTFANDISRFRGSGRDLTDSVLEGRLVSVGGTCRRDGPNAVLATVTTGIELTRGPAASSRTTEIEYFVAISEGEHMLDRGVYPLKAEFPPNTDRVRLVGDSVDLRLPVTAEKTAAAYTVSVGFQLTPEELEVNRRRLAR